MDALYHTVDGNFHQNQKDKPLDVDDTPLTKGASYYADEEDFEKLQRMLPPPIKEVCGPVTFRWWDA